MRLTRHVSPRARRSGGIIRATLRSDCHLRAQGSGLPSDDRERERRAGDMAPIQRGGERVLASL